MRSGGNSLDCPFRHVTSFADIQSRAPIRAAETQQTNGQICNMQTSNVPRSERDVDVWLLILILILVVYSAMLLSPLDSC